MRGAWIILLLMAVGIGWAQDSVKTAIVRPGLYIDYAKALGNALDHKKWEGGFELLFLDKIQTIAEYGQWHLNPEAAIENGHYEVEGNYTRIGVGYIPMVDPSSRMGIGIRYAMANYSDRGDYTIINTSGAQPDIYETFARRNQSAQWIEAVVYTDKAVNKWLTAGFTFRLRFMQQYTAFDEPAVMIIPGYGNANDKTVPAVNLFFKITPF